MTLPNSCEPVGSLCHPEPDGAERAEPGADRADGAQGAGRQLCPPEHGLGDTAERWQVNPAVNQEKALLSKNISSRLKGYFSYKTFSLAQQPVFYSFSPSLLKMLCLFSENCQMMLLPPFAVNKRSPVCFLCT